MKLKALKQGGIAISCRKNIYFKKGDILEAKDGKLALKNLERLVELGYAVEITEGKSHVDKAVDKTKVVDTSVDRHGDIDSSERISNSTYNRAESDSGIDESVPYYRRINDKTELDTFAKEQYNIDLDRRRSLEKMQDQLEEALNKLKNEGK